jgi:hypothetical protein
MASLVKLSPTRVREQPVQTFTVLCFYQRARKEGLILRFWLGRRKEPCQERSEPEGETEHETQEQQRFSGILDIADQGVSTWYRGLR